MMHAWILEEVIGLMTHEEREMAVVDLKYKRREKGKGSIQVH